MTIVLGLIKPADAVATGDTRSWTGVKASLGPISLVGVSDIDLNASDVLFEHNDASGSNGVDAAAPIDWGQDLDLGTGFGNDPLSFDPDPNVTGDEVTLDLAAIEQTTASGTLDLSIQNFVNLSGSFALERTATALRIAATAADASLRAGAVGSGWR